MKDLLSKAVTAASPSTAPTTAAGSQQYQSAFQVRQSGRVMVIEAMEDFSPLQVAPDLLLLG